MPTFKSLFTFRTPSSSPRSTPTTSRKSSISHISLAMSSPCDEEKEKERQQQDDITFSSSLSSQKESEQQTWQRMLLLQQRYHCYNSARLEAAVEALERGYTLDMIPIPSRICLDLLNQELRAQVEMDMQQDYE